ncbi:MAG: anthranilate synthase component I [Ktedonobacterales bacterium]
MSASVPGIPAAVATQRDERPLPMLTPLWREIPADLETPVSAYLKLARGRYGYLLESVEGGERLARYSFVGVEPYLVLRVRDGVAEHRWLRGERAGSVTMQPCADPLEPVRAELDRRRVAPCPDLPRFHGGAVGYLAYEAACHFEPSVPPPDDDPLGVPDAVYCFSDTLLSFYHARQCAVLLTHFEEPDADGSGRAAAEARLDEMARRLAERASRAPRGQRRSRGPHPVTPPSRLEQRAAHAEAVARIREYIKAGDAFQVVASRRIGRPCAAHPFDVYRALRSINPSPYMFYLALDEMTIAGASPELLVRVENGEVAIHPIAGTRRRDADPQQDAALEAELRQDEKERAEHIMLVDLGRNDVGRVSVPGSVRVTQLLDVERYSHVMHLVSHVTGRLRPGLTAFDALRAGFPAGTLTGAPKLRAMRIIAELEGQRRGVYGGAVGYIGYDGNMDTCIAIRSLMFKHGVAYAQAGGGVVADSQPDAEYMETENKLAAVLRALEEAEKRCSC